MALTVLQRLPRVLQYYYALYCLQSFVSLLRKQVVFLGGDAGKDL